MAGVRLRHFGLIVASALLVACAEDVAVQSEAATPKPPQSHDATPSVARTIATTVAATTTTEWTPPSISHPTIPYTLPADYGATPPVTRDVNAAPRPTFARDAVLPPFEWTIDDTLTVQFATPDHFRQDPMPGPAIQDYDRANGLYLVERWATGELTFATLSVQARPGDDSPLLSRIEFIDSLTANDITWHLWNSGSIDQTGLEPNHALAVLCDWLLMISGSPTSIRSVPTRSPCAPDRDRQSKVSPHAGSATSIGR